MTRAWIAIFLFLVQTLACATEEPSYRPSRVVYDFSNSNPKILGQMLDRASFLQKIYQDDVFESSIVFVIHEGAVPLFVKHAGSPFQEMMHRARSLVMGEIIQFRICEASAAMQGFKENDFQDFVKMVPMGDAEIIKLQHQGYAYLK